MSQRQLSFFVIFALLFSMGAVLVPGDAFAQRACMMGPAGDTECRDALGVEFRCMGGALGEGGRCNLPPPIWNSVAPGIGADGQAAGFDVQDNSRVRGDLTIGDTASVTRPDRGNLRANAIYSRTGGEDNIWIGDDNDSIRIQGGIRADGTIRGTFVASDGAGCIGSQILKRNAENTAWTCAADATVAGGGSWATLTGFPAVCAAGEFVIGVNTTGPTRPFICAAPAGGGGAGLSGGVAGKVPYWIDGDTLGQNTNFHWDNTADGGAGRLGIGTATPAFTLDVRGNRIIVRNPSGNAELDLQSGTDTQWGIYSDQASDELRFWRDDENRFRLSAGGNLTITGGATIGADLSAVNLIASTQVRTPELCLGGVCRIAWPAGGGGGGAPAWATITGFPTDCGASEYVAGVGTGGPLTCRTLPAAGAGGLTGTGAANKLAFWTGASTLDDNVNLHFDSVSGRLGVGTATPSETLELRDDTATTARLRLTDTAQNPEFQFQYGGAADDHWAFYVDQGTREIRLWRGDNRLTLTAGGDLRASGCLGATFAGATVETYDGILVNDGGLDRGNGYRDADVLCAGAPGLAGSHVCSTPEILESVRCSAAGGTILAATGTAWINNGPPGHTSLSNDCDGRTNNAGTTLGAFWRFEAAGGRGNTTTCNLRLRFACCR